MVNDALGSTMHEAGHGIYEQGLPEAHIGEPMGQAISLGIHESQSRMWENQVGRSAAFWKWCQPRMKEFFGTATDMLSFDDVYGGANIVQPGFIRVEADEATYNMHPMIRFEIERALLKGDMNAADVPEAWNATTAQLALTDFVRLVAQGQAYAPDDNSTAHCKMIYTAEFFAEQIVLTDHGRREPLVGHHSWHQIHFDAELGDREVVQYVLGP